MTGVRWRVVEKLADDLDEQITEELLGYLEGQASFGIRPGETAEQDRLTFNVMDLDLYLDAPLWPELEFAVSEEVMPPSEHLRLRGFLDRLEAFVVRTRAELDRLPEP
jgi:hypothetical protein